MLLVYHAREILLKGLLNTALITIGAGCLALVLAFLAGLARLSRSALIRGITLVYVEVFRGVSLLVQLFWLFYVLPFFGIDLAPVTTAVLAFGFCNGAYGAEIVRSAILAVPKGQTDAALALNYTRAQRLWKVLIPQAIPIMLPPFGNLMIELLKATSLVSLITIPDLSFQALILRQTTQQTLGPFIAALAGYFAIALLITAAFQVVERRARSALGRGAL